LRIPDQPSAVKTVWRHWKKAPEDDVPDGDLGDRVPELLEPAPHVDAGNSQEREHDHDRDDPRGDLRDPPMVRFPFGCGRDLGADAVICGSSGRGLAHR
jgi:hypothetical protein